MTMHALIYCRVSSKKQTSEGSGLSSQEQRCRKYAIEKGYQVEMVFPDDVTGGGDFMKRPGMVAMLSFLKASKSKSFVVIFDDLKRLSRDTKYYLILKEELAKLNARIECLNFTFDATPEGKFVETVIAAGGELEREQQARQTRQKVNARFENGYWATNAPLGYKMQNERGKPRILVRDEPIATYIQEALEGFACGRFQTIVEVKRFLDTFPEFPKTKTKGVHVDVVKKLLIRPVYAGLVSFECRDISLRKGQHEGLISVTNYQKNQVRMQNRAKAPARKDLNRDFVLRGAISCADCNTVMTACWSKGRRSYYPYYLCREKGCESYGKSIKREELESQFEALLNSLTPSLEIQKTAKSIFRTLWEGINREKTQRLAALKEEIQALDAQKERTIEKLIDTNVQAVVEACEKRIKEIELKKAELQEKIASNDTYLTDYDTEVRTAINFICNPLELWNYGGLKDYEYKRLVLRLAFTDLIQYKRNEGFRTAEIAQPFRVLKEYDSNLSKMVGRAGFEPATN